MPELPEVEVVRRGLDSHIVGRTFERVEVLHPRATRGNTVDLEQVLPGRTVTGTGRRGKYLWLVLDGGGAAGGAHALLVHLRMSGQMLVGPPGSVQSPHLRIRALMSGGGVSGGAGDRAGGGVPEPVELAFVDQRTFGFWQYCELVQVPGTADTGRTAVSVPAPAAHIAPDPFEEAFDAAAAARVLRQKRSPLKSVLLNQEVVSGIGSIYADEAMWAAGVKPWRTARTMRQRDAVAVLEASKRVMAQSLEQGGTSFDSLYVNVNGASGYFSRSLNAYGQAGKPCTRCGTPIERVVVGQRSSYFCPVCQIR